MPRLGAHRRSQAAQADRVRFAGTEVKIIAGFAEALQSEAHRHGMSPVEFALWSAAERLQRAGRDFAGLFEPGDLPREDS